MSETDSFIDEVTEEVRRDQLFALFRKYGWIGVLAIVLIVGTASWNEWKKAQAEATAQAFGDALVAAMGNNDSASRAKALADVAAGDKIAGSAGRAAVTALMQSAEAEAAGDRAGALALLKAVSENSDVPALYRDLAELKGLMLDGAALDPAARDTALAKLAVPGAPYRTLAMEQQALILLDAGKADEAVAQFRAIAEDADTPQSQRGRVGQILSVLWADTAEG